MECMNSGLDYWNGVYEQWTGLLEWSVCIIYLVFIMYLRILWYLTDLCYTFCVAGLRDCVSLSIVAEMY